MWMIWDWEKNTNCSSQIWMKDNQLMLDGRRIWWRQVLGGPWVSSSSEHRGTKIQDWWKAVPCFSRITPHSRLSTLRLHSLTRYTVIDTIHCSERNPQKTQKKNPKNKNKKSKRISRIIRVRLQTFAYVHEIGRMRILGTMIVCYMKCSIHVHMYCIVFCVNVLYICVCMYVLYVCEWVHMFYTCAYVCIVLLVCMYALCCMCVCMCRVSVCSMYIHMHVLYCINMYILYCIVLIAFIVYIVCVICVYVCLIHVYVCLIHVCVCVCVCVYL